MGIDPDEADGARCSHIDAQEPDRDGWIEIHERIEALVRLRDVEIERDKLRPSAQPVEDVAQHDVVVFAVCVLKGSRLKSRRPCVRMKGPVAIGEPGERTQLCFTTAYALNAIDHPSAPAKWNVYDDDAHLCSLCRGQEAPNGKLVAYRVERALFHKNDHIVADWDRTEDGGLFVRALPLVCGVVDVKNVRSVN